MAAAPTFMLPPRQQPADNNNSHNKQKRPEFDANYGRVSEAGMVVLVSFMYVMMRQVADFSRYLMWRNKIS